MTLERALKKFLFIPLCVLLLVSCFTVFHFVPSVHSALTWATVGGNLPLYYIPVTLTNNQGIPTSSTFQEQITVNSNTNSAVYASNLDNVNWQDGAGNILKSWLESGMVNTNSASVYWVNLGSNTIAASGGTLIIYQVIYATTVNAMDSVITGAAPQYTSTYGQYDNGAAVFPTLYQNFMGTSTPSGWTNNGATVNNGVSLPSGNHYMLTSATFGLNSSQILDINGTLPTPNTNGASFGYMNTGQTAFNIWDVVKGIYGSSAFGISSNTGSSYAWTAALVTAPSTNIWTIYAPTTSATYYSWNYGSATAVTSNIPTIALPLGAFTGPTTNTLMMQWARMRIYPPNGVMPSASAGSITTISNVGAPIVQNTSPSNLQTNVPITLTQLSFSLSSTNLMNYSVSTNPPIGSGQGLNIPSGTYNVPVTGLEYSTTYQWHVDVTDGTLMTSVTLTFTTESSPSITSYSPESQIIVDRGSSQTFQISFSDPMNTAWYLDGVENQYNAGVSGSSWNWAFGNLGIFNVTCVGTSGEFVLTQQWSVQVLINFSGGVVDRQMTNFGPSQAWENGWVFDESVWKENNIYFMLYAGSPIGQRKIGFAWSSDGFTWTKYSGNPILSPTDPGAGAWENKEDFWPSSVVNVDGNYWVYYQGIDTGGGQHSGLAFLNIVPDGAGGYAITNLARYSGNPIISDTYELTVAQINPTYWIGYNGYGTLNFLDSTDGMHWNYEQRNVITPSGSGWDSGLHYAAHIIFMGGTMYLTVQGNNQQGGVDYCRVGDWTHLTRSQYNPILPSRTGVENYVLGPCPIYDGNLDCLDIWYIAAESLGGTGQTGMGFGRIYGIFGNITSVTSTSPSTQVTLGRGSLQAFQIGYSAPVNVTWYLNSMQQQFTQDVSTDTWSHRFNDLGIFNVTASAFDGLTRINYEWSVQVLINFSGGVVDRQMTNFGPSQAWENGWVFDESVWKENNIYFMLYAGSPIGQRKIGFAWSSDGFTWTKYSGNPILSPTDPGAGAWENKEDFWPSSIFNIDGKYWVYYQGIDTGGGQHSGLAFLNIVPDGAGGYAITNLARYSGNPIIADTYELVVGRYTNTTTGQTMWIGYNGYMHGNFLTSPDGLTWTYVQMNVLVHNSDWWENGGIYAGHIFFMNDTMYLTVQGNNQNGGVVYCRAGDWTDLTRSSYNPILPHGTGVQNYVLGPNPIYDPVNDTLDVWYISAESLGGSGASGAGFGRIYNVTGRNTAPSISNPSPPDGTTKVAASLSSLSFDLADYQGDLMNYFVTTTPNVGSGSGNNVANGRYSIDLTGLTYSTTYTWTVSVSDGQLWTTKTFSFTTGPKQTINPFSEGWQYRKEITLDHTKVVGDQTDFPVELTLTDSDLASKAQPDGHDILFTNGTGEATRLSYQIEFYNPSVPTLVVWIRIPNLSSTVDTVIYMYYGNPSCLNQQDITGVWDSNFVMVQHLSETSGTHYDSTIYHNNGTPSGVLQGIAGKIDGADSFDGVNDYIECTNDPSLSPTRITLEAWINPNTITGTHPIIEKYDWISGKGSYLLRQQDSNILFDLIDGTSEHPLYANNVLQTGNWYYVVGTFDGTSLKIYINGALSAQTSWTGNILAGDQTLKIGTRGNDETPSSKFFSGLIDEAVVSNIARSAGWVATRYDDELNSPAFYTIGSEEQNYLPVLQTAPGNVICREFGEYFTVQVNVTNAINLDGFNFTIYYSPTMINYVSVSWGDLGSGTITKVDQTNGILAGYVIGTAITGNRWLLNVTFQDLATMIWKQGQANALDGQIWFHNASLSFSGIQQLTYQEGGLGQISVNNVGFKFMPIQGDLNNDGIVDITDLRTVAAYYDVKQGDMLWSVASAYDLNSNGAIDIYDLVLIGANFG